jgi:hypothetical protein
VEIVVEQVQPQDIRWLRRLRHRDEVPIASSYAEMQFSRP